MAITLGKPREAGWLELYNGASLYVLPATTAMVQLAQSRADSLLADLKDAGVAVTKAGGQIVDVPDVADELAADGMRRALFVVSLAELGCSDWRNILDADGEPLKFDPGRLAELFTDPMVSQSFLPRYLGGVHAEIEAGNA
ncbi:MAG TPA: hypothetical protein VGN60_00770 [Devosia sp.]|jgi:hypothetical protein|nr:hypothetical protein [Devosia sp.]